MIRTFGILIALCLLSQQGFSISVRSLAFRLPEDFPSEIELTSAALAKEEPKTVKVAAPGFGLPFELPPGDYIATSPRLPGQVHFSLPESTVPKFLLVIISSRSGEWEIMPIPDDSSVFQKGDFRVINATPTDIGVRFSKTKILLKSSHSTVMKMPDADFKHGQFEVEMSTVIAGKLTVFNSTIWRRTPKLRTLVLLYIDPKTSRYRTMTIGDYEFSEKKPSETGQGL